ncbi:hypothetical protein B0H67DRAFT_644143 [Lasiosphaeris hirsuta]|uniref:SRR1-like domain-containing protein n=1 Tax=Lasiosphaeris hirsuta TaxID=260670 RepID=A0AA40E1N8_9PEZI|nr:hypothetical protein B0H67DRAFT_644143 [Lasiosphaeris hirsuta]
MDSGLAPPKATPSGLTRIRPGIEHLKPVGNFGPRRRPELDAYTGWKKRHRSLGYLSILEDIYNRLKAPFFSKAALLKVCEAFELWTDGRYNNHPLFLTDLRGRMFEFTNQRCKEFMGLGEKNLADSEIGYFLQPLVQYAPINHLKSCFRPGDISPNYLPTTVVYTLQKYNKKTNQFIPDDSEKTNPNFSNMLANFVRDRQTWRNTDHFRHLAATLAAITPPPNINKIIAFGCGTLEHKDKRIRLAQRSNSGVISCWAQNPAYPRADKEILEGFGYKLVQDPVGFIKVDEHSVVVSIRPDVPVRQIVADIAEPAVMVWEGVPNVESTTESQLEDPDPCPD